MLYSSALRRAVLAIVIALPAACAATPEQSAPAELPVTRWDHRPEAADWTRAALSAVETHGAALPATLPADIETFCPGYATASEDDRAAFWVGLMSALARYESTWRPEAAGAGGRYRGLLQISPQTARNYGCAATDRGLYDGAANLSCAIRIASRQVARTGVVAGKPGAWGGIAADWMPMRDASKRAEIARWTASQQYCQRKA
ncbi:transglycosylase SLT domain-containing protein [Plastorhodobacter daqingensis]|uniref:Transglycosylase SLT domain-containing protein n=1 Tax=Plastorhodobacter daqingensis TaxID=1387281 RepID=A0ABW2UJ84_9RHOB